MSPEKWLATYLEALPPLSVPEFLTICAALKIDPMGYLGVKENA